MSEDKITLDHNDDDAINKETGKIEEAEEPVLKGTPNVPEEMNGVSSSDNAPLDTTGKKKTRINLYKIVRIICIIGFFVFTALFINEVLIQPYRIKKSIEATRELYNRPSESPVVTAVPTEAVTTTAEPTPAIAATPTPDPNRDEQGRLLQFADLLAANMDVKGWITIDDTNIDYVVTQPGSDKPDDYYLDKDIYGEYSKAGTLYLDPLSSIEAGTQNLIIHGHNMVSTKEKMFHYLLQYKNEDLEYYKKHPLIKFDTIYNTGEWKIFAVFITPGNADSKDFFDYRKSTFQDASDFLNFVYQLRIRSIISIDSVDINENDQLLTLSTCSYELDNYRTVIVARKVREGEDVSVNVESSTYNTKDQALYPSKYYYYKGGKAPEFAATFEEALENGQINWYKPINVDDAE
jgi:sortase B